MRIKKKRKLNKPSLRFDIVNGAFRKYPDGREVCLDNKAGRDEYVSRTKAMHERQGGICSRGTHRIVIPTFDHSDEGRGMGGSHQDDRIYDANGNPMNSCSCMLCNGQAGSKRIVESC